MGSALKRDGSADTKIRVSFKRERTQISLNTQDSELHYNGQQIRLLIFKGIIYLSQDEASLGIL